MTELCDLRCVSDVLAAVFVTIGFIRCFYAIYRAGKRPAPSTWIIWTVLDAVVLYGMVAEGSVNGQILTSTIGAGLLMIVSLVSGKSEWTRVDICCLVSGLSCIPIVFLIPVVGIILGLAIILLGAIPTIMSVIEDPTREDRWTWVLFSLACICALLGITNWTFQDAAQPIVFSIIEFTVLGILYCHPAIRRSDERDGDQQ